MTGASSDAGLSPGHSGHYQVLVEVSVQEGIERDGTTTANSAARMDAASVVYEQAFYEDRRRCSEAARAAVEGHVKAVEFAHTLPDPLPQGAIHELLEALADIRETLAGPDVSREVASNAVRVVAGELGISAGVLTRLLPARSERRAA